MRIERITYSTSRQISEVFWEKIGVEASLGEGDDPETELITLKGKVEDVQKKFNEPRLYPLAEVLPVDQMKKEPKEAAIDSQIEAIAGCTSLKSLEIFKKLVDREAVPRLTEAFYKKQQELQ